MAVGPIGIATLDIAAINCATIAGAAIAGGGTIISIALALIIVALIAVTRSAPGIARIDAAIAWRLGAVHNRRVKARECTVTIGSRYIHPTHHHLIHQQIGTPAQKLRAFLDMAAVARRIIVKRLRRWSRLWYRARDTLPLAGIVSGF
jgi:hypothetical protein